MKRILFASAALLSAVLVWLQEIKVEFFTLGIVQ